MAIESEERERKKISELLSPSRPPPSTRTEQIVDRFRSRTHASDTSIRAVFQRTAGEILAHDVLFIRPKDASEDVSLEDFPLRWTAWTFIRDRHENGDLRDERRNVASSAR